MSRIDYITLALVALCLGALIFLLVKVARIDDSLPSTLAEEEEKVGKIVVDSTVSSDTPAIAMGDTVVSLPQKKQGTVLAGEEKRYLVVAASFPEEQLAQKELDRLMRLGYADCEIGYFNQRKIVSVIAGRFDDYGIASAFAQKMNEQHQLEAYVHRKRLQ
ncbi:MAG TPA: SPOR domain-containing protein [Saprospiraceae bacterium]|nr:SPOR domain-containing protein [Saprospiraceae bacterium]